MVKSEKEHVLLWRLFKVKCFYAWILLFSTMQLIYAAVCNVNFDVRSKWSDGFVVDVVLQNNTDTTMRNWQVVWQGVPFSVSNIWRAILAGSNDDTLYIRHQSYNQNIYPYNIETFGFTGQGSFHLPNWEY
ncbi:cellulose binding domain-containing protein [Facilibium subflavum]|uniref:cellulose binding domain-containing protein n=1 Tax=Facilibium subflavum TaxID=2219058 RepID=UPI000E647518|nr:cellulose binding domain-containing protein [Facilibium subflavum]